MRFQRQPENIGGWTLNTEMLRNISKEIDRMDDNGETADSPPSWEQIESVLLAVERLEERGFESTEQPSEAAAEEGGFIHETNQTRITP